MYITKLSIPKQKNIIKKILTVHSLKFLAKSRISKPLYMGLILLTLPYLGGGAFSMRQVARRERGIL